MGGIRLIRLYSNANMSVSTSDTESEEQAGAVFRRARERGDIV